MQVRNLGVAGLVGDTAAPALNTVTLSGVLSLVEVVVGFGGFHGTCVVSMLKNLSARSSAWSNLRSPRVFAMALRFGRENRVRLIEEFDISTLSDRKMRAPKSCPDLLSTAKLHESGFMSTDQTLVGISLKSDR